MPIMTIKVEVQAEACGPVMIALRKMPGVMNFQVDLDAFAPSPAALRLPGGPTIKDTVIAALLKSYPQPLKAAEIARQTGLHKPSIHTVLHGKLKESGFIELTIGKTWRLTDKAAIEMGALKVLAPPDKKAEAKPAKKAKANGKNHGEARPARFSGEVLWAHLYECLKDGAKRRSDIISYMTAHGMRDKGIGSLLSRVQANKLLKSDGHGAWWLTPKGQAKVPNELRTHERTHEQTPEQKVPAEHQPTN